MEPRPIPLAVADGCMARVRHGWVRAQPIGVAPSGPELLAEMDGLAAELRRTYEGRPPSEVAGLAHARRLYRAFGIDPTRTRPSSEALIRRAIRGKPLPRVSNAVDLCNLCSMSFPLPIGLFDAGRVRGAVIVRAGLPGESYPGIRKDDVHLEGRPVLADEDGPFGNPTSDSRRTSVTDGTRSLWMVIFAPADYAADALERHVTTARDLVERHLGAGDEPVRTAGGSAP